MEARSTRRLPTPRRRPSSGAAEQIVDAIIGAAELLLDRDGLDGLTTNAIAHVAGVSVGSLYRYFPDKMAIVAEIARRLQTAALSVAREAMALVVHASARDTISRIVDLSLSPAFGTGVVRRMLLREVPRVWYLRETRVTDAMIGDVLAAFFLARSDEVRTCSVESVFVAQHAFEGIVEAVLLARPGELPTTSVQRELFHLGWAYFARDGAPLERPAAEIAASAAREREPDPSLVRRLVEERSRRRTAPTRQRSVSQRALATRDAIVASTVRVLAREGFAGLTVRAIAAEAGVAVGALYRHFSRPETAVAEVASRLEADAASELAPRLEGARGLPDLAGAIIGAYGIHPRASVELRRAVLSEVPWVWAEAASMSAQRESLEGIVVALDNPEVRDGDRELMAFFALHAVKTATEAFILLSPECLDERRLHRELAELVCRYLRRRSPS